MALTVLEYIRSDVWTLPRACLERLAGEFPDVRVISPADERELAERLPEADVVLGPAVRRTNIARAGRVRWIQLTAAGVASFLFPELIDSPIVVTSGRGLHARAMAEHTLGVMLAFVRQLHLARDAQRERRWTQAELWHAGAGFGELDGATVGLVGFGAVGHAIAGLLGRLGLEVIAVRRHPAADPAPARAQWGLERLPELAARADWLVLVAPGTAETRGMLSRELLSRMKPTARVVNLGRGSLVDEPALIEALRAGRIAGAALDVFATEPLSADSPLWEMPQVILTPHVSGVGPRYWERSVELFARNLHHFQRGEPLENVVDKRAGY
ncbi:MAG TPA: D-2-hydroxyacid dehydrogenase [Candidatus Eisenbacteria bacterium]|nr:D-2-hydroxyacid dehydrogenase [Candidatus Eisenbacteria bacterium]